MFANKKIIITGAAGGIGTEVVKLLAKEKANLFLLGSSAEKLSKLQDEVKTLGGSANFAVIDLSNISGIKDAAAIISEIDNPDILINLAGISYFGSFGLQKFAEIEQLYNINILAPTILTQAILPEMVKKNSGQIVNIGSIFGSIAFPYFATYSTSKAALRSFSESLRRELDGAGVKVTYIAPRAVKTKINEGLNSQFLQKTKTAIDEPEKVAKQILCAISKQKKNAYLGFPEKLFVRLNYLLPSLVDKALKQPTQIAKELLTENQN